MDSDIIFILITEFGLLGIPIVSFQLYREFKGNRKFILWLIAFIVLLAIGRYFDLTFRGDSADLLLPVGIYLCYCFFICNLLLIRNKFLRVVAFIIGLLPVALGYIGGTLGILGVMMSSAEEVANKTVDLGDNYYYRQYGFGNATTSEGGKKIEIYKPIFLFPLVEKRILSKKLDYRYYNTDSIKVKFDENNEQFNIKIFSKDKIQVDTILNK